ncbi:3-oxo-tetronate 4-phosphate decarboxylase [Agaribacter flavus]|uniref:3-oxo-tetronate 4-phosphate decarboxylase n=1 Tax=Agaribacter flavus TaxID=1902781 RepID=A0ABV7FMS8_9ALTE
MSNNSVITIEQAKKDIIDVGKSIFDRGLTCGSSANISVKIQDGYVVTPTNSCIGFLKPDTLSVLDSDGKLVSGDKPSKEFILHEAFYQQRPDANSVIHLHSSYATAVSCFDKLDENDVVTPYTPYLIMRLGAICLIPYFPPGDTLLADAVAQKAANYAGILMANHGPIVAGNNLWSTMYAIEELEESCKMMVLLQQHQTRQLSPADRQTLIDKFKK